MENKADKRPWLENLLPTTFGRGISLVLNLVWVLFLSGLITLVYGVALISISTLLIIEVLWRRLMAWVFR